MQGLWQRFRLLPRWGRWTLGVLAALLLIALVAPGDDGGEDRASTTTVTVTVPAPPPTATTTTTEPARTIAAAQAAVDADDYPQALAIAAELGHDDTIRRRISNRLARRALSAVRSGSRSRASSLLRQADGYPRTYDLTLARASYRAANARVAERARLRKQAAERAAAQLRAEQEAAAAEPDPEPTPESSDSGCDTNYSGCVPAYPPDVNCPQVSGPVTVIGGDPHGLDRDGDRVACE